MCTVCPSALKYVCGRYVYAVYNIIWSCERRWVQRPPEHPAARVELDHFHCFRTLNWPDTYCKYTRAPKNAAAVAESSPKKTGATRFDGSRNSMCMCVRARAHTHVSIVFYIRLCVWPVIIKTRGILYVRVSVGKYIPMCVCVYVWIQHAHVCICNKKNIVRYVRLCVCVRSRARVFFFYILLFDVRLKRYSPWRTIRCVKNKRISQMRFMGSTIKINDVNMSTSVRALKEIERRGNPTAR